MFFASASRPLVTRLEPFLRRATLPWHPIIRNTLTERRSQLRLLDCELVMLSWTESSIEYKQLGNVEDVSLGGLGLVVDHPLPPGTPVRIAYGEDSLLRGTVKHHSERDGNHYIGVEFDEDSRNSTLHFQPELLVRPV